MELSEILLLVKKAEEDSLSPYELAISVAEKQKEIDANIVDGISPLLKEISDVIRNTF